MKKLSELKVGDRVGLRNDLGAALKLGTVEQIAVNGIFIRYDGVVGNAMLYDAASGAGVSRRNGHSQIDTNWQSVDEELKAARTEREKERAEREAFEATPEFELARTMIDQTGSTDCVGQFARLGLDKLRQIETWLNEANAPTPKA